MIRLVLTLTVLTIGVLDFANGYCCNQRAPNIKSHISFCADCTHGEWCCAHGRCNVFCCNCDDGCRQGTCWEGFTGGRRRRDVTDELNGNWTQFQDETSGYTILQDGDINSDGRLSIDEAHAMLESRGAPAARYRGKLDLHALDIDGDNYLSPSEIDRDAQHNAEDCL